MLCRDVMLSFVYRCSGRETAQTCARLMRDHRIGFVPVMDATGKAIGVVTDRDIAVRVVAEGKPITTPVAELMTVEALLTCRPDEDLRSLETRMAHRRKSRAIVVGDDGSCIGVISLSDIAQAEDVSRSGRLLRDLTRREAVQLMKP